MKLPEWQDVKDVVNRVLPQIDREDIRIDCTLDGVEIYADPLLERVMYNLIENAVLYGKTLTAITISGQEVQDGFIIMVKDNGVGIPAAEKEKIFYRGFGTNAGLGLFLAREILGITGITITETGAPGKGARFELLVPKDEYRFVRQ
jgi:signal transduction histidine kinase